MSKKRVIVCAALAVLVLIMVGIGVFAIRQSASQSANMSEGLLRLGEKYLTELNYEQALVQFLKVIEVEPMNPRGYTGAAEICIALGQTDKAIEILEQGLELLPDSDEIKQMLAGLQTELESAIEDISGAVEIAETSTELPPDIEIIVENLYQAYLAGDMEQVFTLHRTPALTDFLEDFSESTPSDEVYLIKPDGKLSVLYGDASIFIHIQSNFWTPDTQNGTHYNAWSNTGDDFTSDNWCKAGLSNGVHEGTYEDYSRSVSVYSGESETRTRGTLINGGFHGEVYSEQDIYGESFIQITTYSDGYVQLPEWSGDDENMIPTAIDENGEPTGWMGIEQIDEYVTQRQPFGLYGLGT